MDEIVHEFSTQVSGYTVKAVTEPNGNVWVAWLEFHPPAGGTILRTGQETSQLNRDAVVYWASGLEVVYLEGALSRAKSGVRS